MNPPPTQQELDDTPLTQHSLVPNSDFSDWGVGDSNYVSADDMRDLEVQYNRAIALLKRHYTELHNILHNQL